MNRIKFYYSIRYTKPVQLIARLQLLIKRKYLERFCDHYNHKFSKVRFESVEVESPPPPIFKKREGYFKRNTTSDKSFSLRFLNEAHDFSFPINWHEKKLEYGTRLWKLNLHYHEFLEELNNEWFSKIISDWIQHNPTYKKGYWLDSWNSFSLSIRVVVWMQQVALRKNDLEAAFIKNLNDSLMRQIMFLSDNIEEDIRGNHIIKNIKALLWACRYFSDDINTQKWKVQANKLLLRELNVQILDDGMHFERSPAYHSQVFADLLECYSVIENSSTRDLLEKKLCQMAQVLINTTHPDGKISLFNDGGLNMTYETKELIDLYTKMTGYSASKDTVFQHDESGYYGYHNNESYFLYDAGKIAPDTLPAHGHGDIFSFEWTILNHRFFIDKGVYEYNSGERRDLSRSTRSHNTVLVDNEDQCEFWGSFRVARRANVKIKNKVIDESGIKISAYHDGYKRLSGSPIHERSINFDGKNLLINDSVNCGSGQPVEARFLIHPDVNICIHEDSCTLKKDEITLQFETNSPYKIIETSWYPDFGLEIPCKQIVVSYGSAPVNGNCRIILLE